MPKISLIIPTRNGADYVWAPIRTILSQKYLDFELLVSVNHSTDNTLALLRQFHDPRLRILVPPRPLSMTGHYEWCLQQATGEWVTILGDDDGVMLYFFSELEKLFSRHESKPVDAFVFRRAYYYWPGCEDIYGRIAISARAIQSEKKLLGNLSILRAIFFDLEHFDLPQVYTNNLIRRTLIEKIRSSSGGLFYNELNPDVYSGVAVALHARLIIRSELPLFWTGTSPKSVAIALSKLEDASGKPQSNSDGKANDRAREFLAFAQNDKVSVAPEVGIDAWRGLKSSPIWVLSALFNIPFKKPWLFSRHMLLLLGACVRASVSLQHEHDYGMQIKKKRLLKDIISRNGINHYFFFGAVMLSSPILKTGWLMKKCISRLSAYQGCLYTLRSDSHTDFPDLLTASLAADKEYAKLNPYKD
jgi:hypothetical protein